MAARVFDRGVGFASTLILARLLLPDDFGVVALASSVAAILDLIRRFGFELVLVGRHDAGTEEFDTVWTLNLAFCLLVSLGLALAAAPAASFYEEPRLAVVLWAISLRPAIEGLANIGIVYFHKESRFDKEFKLLAISRIAGFAVAIPMALLMRDHWALVGGILAQSTVRSALSYALHPYRPKLSLAKARDTFSYSSWLAMNNAVQFLVAQSPALLIGKAMGPHSLGVFSLSHEVGYLPASELSAPINRVVFPNYAAQSGDSAALRRGIVRVVSIVSMMVLPLSFGLSLTSDIAVPVLLGEQWRSAIPIVSLLAIYGCLRAISSNTGFIFLATGRPHLILVCGLVESLVLLPLLFWGVDRAGLVGACWAYLASVGCAAPCAYALVVRQLDLRVSALVGATWRPIAGVAAMGLALVLLRDVLPVEGSGFDLVDELVLYIAVGAIVYGSSVAALWRLSGCPPSAESMIVEFGNWGLEQIRLRSKSS